MTLTIREAARHELAAIVRLLADDALGATRELYADPLPKGYGQAFDAIGDDANNELLVADDASRIVGVLQLTYLPNLTYQGRWRAQIEGVRVARSHRGQGVGRVLMEHAQLRAMARNCHVLQLTTNRERDEALEFYESLGFEASHIGLKLPLDRG